MGKPSLTTSVRAVLVCLVALITTAIPCPPTNESLAAGSALRQEAASYTHLTRARTRKARKKSVTPVRSVTLVRDFRFGTHAEYSRIVLELQRSVSFTQSRLKDPDRIVIELQNTRLSEAVRRKLKGQSLPNDISIEQPNPRSVTLLLNLGQIGDYRLLPLEDPDRLVVDLFNRLEEGGKPRPSSNSSSPGSAQAQTASSQTRIPTISAPPRPNGSSINTIVIDPGHGGKDPGALGRKGTAEKEITLQVALKVKKLLAARLGKKVLMTRDRDVFVELEDRAQFANRHNADLFVSIHVNSHPQRSIKGVEVYHFGEASDRRALEVAARENGTPITEKSGGVEFLLADLLTTKKVHDSMELAWSTKESMVKGLDRHYDVVDHGVKTAPFYVLRFTAMPSILTEIAFITNPTEERLMRTDAFQNRMAEAIFDGIKAYLTPAQLVAR